MAFPPPGMEGEVVVLMNNFFFFFGIISNLLDLDIYVLYPLVYRFAWKVKI